MSIDQKLTELVEGMASSDPRLSSTLDALKAAVAAGDAPRIAELDQEARAILARHTAAALAALNR